MHYSKKIKGRIRILILMNSLVVALAFGLSFYFGLVSTESALASRVPELVDVVNKLKNMLLSSTLVFVAILIGSFYILSILLTDRMFKPIETLREDLETIAGGRLPLECIDSLGGPFASLEESHRSARDQLVERERSEIAALTSCVEIAGPDNGATEKLEKIIKDKKRFCGEAEQSSDKAAEGEDAIFMQPV
jgi:hypothetical protein